MNQPVELESAQGTENAVLSDQNNDGQVDFHDFVQQYGYEYGPVWDEQSRRQNPEFAQDGLKQDQAYALAAARDVVSGDMPMQAMSLNQTVNTAFVALAEFDPNDASQGQMHYIAFVGGADPRTYMFTENVTINEDGTFTSEMEEGRGWDMFTGDERSVLESMSEHFIEAAGSPVTPLPTLMADFEISSGRDIAMGGTLTHEGELEVRDLGSRAAVASTSELNDTTGLEIESSYGPGGDGEIKLTVFRENAGAMTAIDSTAGGVDNQAKYDNFSRMSPGIMKLGG